MNAAPLIFDGLQRCLCPGVSRATWLAATRGAARQTQTPRLNTRPLPRSRPTIASLRVYTSSSATVSPTTVERPDARPAEHFAENTTNTSSVDWTHPKDDRAIQALLEERAPSDIDLAKTSDDTIHAAIQELLKPVSELCKCSHEQVYDRIVLLVTWLANGRNFTDLPWILETLMDAMAAPDGSASGISKLTRQMDKETWTPAFCRSALRALAVHPLYGLQVEVLDVMRSQWITIETEDMQNVILGLVRDEQYELAYTRFMTLIQSGATPDLWFYDVLIMAFGGRRNYQAMLDLFQLRTDRDNTGPSYMNVVYQLLEVCSSGFHLEGTATAWTIGVTNGALNPPDGVLDNVLSTGAVHGDAVLATAAYEKFAARTRVRPAHNDALLEALCRGKDFKGTLEVLSLIDSTPLSPRSRYNLGQLFAGGSDQDMFEAAEFVEAMAAEGKPVFQGLETVIAAIARNCGSEQAVDLFRRIHSICGKHPTDRLLRYMIKYSEDLDLRRQMAQLYRDTVAPGWEEWHHYKTYRRLIWACLEIEDLDLALRFGMQLSGLTAQPGRITWKNIYVDWYGELLRAALAAEDKRIWDVYTGLLRANTGAVDYVRRTTTEVMEQFQAPKSQAPEGPQSVGKEKNKRPRP